MLVPLLILFLLVCIAWYIGCVHTSLHLGTAGWLCYIMIIYFLGHVHLFYR